VTNPSGTLERPNIIFILCDDLGYGDLGVQYQTRGPPACRARQRRTWTCWRAKASASPALLPAPVCAPSRASLLLGVHQGHANVRDEQWDKALANNHTLASVLRTAGYATAAIGKWASRQ